MCAFQPVSTHFLFISDTKGAMVKLFLNTTAYGLLNVYVHDNYVDRYGALSPMSFLGGIHIYYTPYPGTGGSRGTFENYIERLHGVQKQVTLYTRSCLPFHTYTHIYY